MSEHYRAIVIGGGIVGASVLYWLARLGWTETCLLERRELTSGSTWHAAGNVTYFGHYSEITPLYVNSIKTYQMAEAETGQNIGFHPAGSLRLATNQHELDAYKRLIPSYEKMAVPYAVVSPEKIHDLHPLLVTEGILGAAHTPTDGHLDPTGATQALAAASRARGATIKRHSPVEEIQKKGDGWQLQTPSGAFSCDHLVICTSFWTRELLAPLGLSPPLFAMEHHEIVTESIPALAELGFEVPTVRDPYAPSNTRQEGTGFLCGVYEAEPKIWNPDGIPKDFKEELLPPDIDRLTEHLMRVFERLPDFADAGIKAANNGPLCYTPDGLPMVGPVAGHQGLWMATGFNVGIGTGGGSAEYLAHWMVDGAPDTPLPLIHADRFSPSLGQQDAINSIRKTYAAGYATPSD